MLVILYYDFEKYSIFNIDFIQSKKINGSCIFSRILINDSLYSTVFLLFSL